MIIETEIGLVRRIVHGLAYDSNDADFADACRASLVYCRSTNGKGAFFDAVLRGDESTDRT